MPPPSWVPQAGFDPLCFYSWYMDDTNPFASFAFDGERAAISASGKRAAPQALLPGADQYPPRKKQATRRWVPVKLETAAETAAAQVAGAAETAAARVVAGELLPAVQSARPRKMSSKYAMYSAAERIGRAAQKESRRGGVVRNSARTCGDNCAIARTAAPMSSAAWEAPLAGATTCAAADPIEHDTTRDKADAQPDRAGWRRIFLKIRRHRAERDATVDAFHQYLLDLRSEPEGDFLVLVAGLLSVQARDNVAMAAMRRLRATFDALDNTAAEESRRGLCVDAVCHMPLERLEQHLNTLNFYRTKAGYIKGCAEALQRYPHNGRVPRTQQKLQKLPGVGPKVALLVLSVGFAQGDAGIVVDTHVHRVSTRLGWAIPPNRLRAAFSGASGSTTSAEDTRTVLQSFVPADDWPDFTTVLIGFGQKTCLAQRPRCHECPVADECPSAHSGTTGGAQ